MDTTIKRLLYTDYMGPIEKKIETTVVFLLLLPLHRLVYYQYKTCVVSFRWTPHPVIVTTRDNRDYSRVLLYSSYATITGWAVLLKSHQLSTQSTNLASYRNPCTGLMIVVNVLFHYPYVMSMLYPIGVVSSFNFLACAVRSQVNYTGSKSRKLNSSPRKEPVPL